MGEFSPMHWLVVIAVCLLIFGPGKLPEIGKSLGQGIREFKKAMKEVTSTEETGKTQAISKAEPVQDKKVS